MKLFLLFALVAVVAVVAAFLTVALGPGNQRAEFDRAAAALRAHPRPSAPVTEADLAPLPPAVQRWLRICGVVGQPRPNVFHARFRGGLRGGPEEAWMPIRVEQVSRLDPPARLFYLDARMNGVPVTGLHRYVDGAASMRIKLLGALTIVDASGPDMTQSETVTLFNDVCLLAPAGLLDSMVTWGETRADTVFATYANAGHVVHAGLVFGTNGDLVDFLSDDRSALARDGRSATRQRWTTPVSEWRTFGPHRLFGVGEAHWHPASGEFAYGRFEALDIGYDAAPARADTATH